MSRRIASGLMTIMVLTLALAAPAVGQDKLDEGVWSGSAFTPDGEVFDLSFDVSYADDMLAIELILPPEAGMGNIMVGDPVYEADTVAFTLKVGESISCSLAALDDGSFEGECVGASGEAAVMTMIPPEG